MIFFLKKHWILIFFLAFGAFLRWFNLPESMSFFYDQARDALAAKGILHGDFVLVGPTTDMPGLFFGPVWYYFLAILYFLTGGHPAWTLFLVSFFDLATIALVFLVGSKIFDRKTGLLTAFIWSVGALPVAYARTLSNPSTTAFWTLLVVYCFLQIDIGKKLFLIPAWIFSAALFQFNAAAAFLLLPFTFTATILGKGLLKNKKLILISLFLFVLSFTPQIVYELRNSFLGTNSIIKIFTTSGPKEGYYHGLRLRFENTKMELTNYTFYSNRDVSLLVLAIGLIIALFHKFPGKKIFFLWFTLPIVSFLFIYSRDVSHPFYLLSWIPAAIFLFANLVSRLMSKKFPFAILGILILSVFIYLNFFGLQKEIILKDHIAQPGDPNLIGLNDQLRVIDYLYKHASGEGFGYYSYNITPYWADHNFQYLFPWYGQTKYGYVPQRNTGDNLFVIYEPEPYLGQVFQDKWLSQFRAREWKNIGKTKIGPYNIERIQRAKK